MKKIYLLLTFCNILVFSSFTAKSQNGSSIQVTENNNILQVSFLLPAYTIIDTTKYLNDIIIIENENNKTIKKVVIVKDKGLVSYTTADGEEWKLVE